MLLCRTRCYLIADFYRYLIKAFHSARIHVGTVQDEVLHIFGISEREGNGDISAVGKAEDMRLFYAFLIHEIMQVACKLSYGKRRISARTPAVSSRIGHYHAEILAKIFLLKMKIFAAFAVSVQENERKPRAVLGIVKLYIHLFLRVMILSNDTILPRQSQDAKRKRSIFEIGFANVRK